MVMTLCSRLSVRGLNDTWISEGMERLGKYEYRKIGRAEYVNMGSKEADGYQYVKCQLLSGVKMACLV